MNPSSGRSTLALLHASLCIGCLGFLAVLCVLLWQERLPLLGTAGPVVHWSGPALAALLVPVAFTVLRTLLAKVASAPSAEAAGQAVRAAAIAHWAILEAACFANGVLFLLTADLSGLATAALVLGILVWRAPTAGRVARWHLGLP